MPISAPRRVFAALLGMMIALALLVAYSDVTVWSFPLALAAGAYTVAIAIGSSPRGWVSPAAIYGYVFVAFQLGVVLALLLGLPAGFSVPGFPASLDLPELRAAAALVGMGLVASSLAILLVSPLSSPKEPPSGGSTDFGLAIVGAASLLLGLMLWFAVFFACGGFSLLREGYGAWLTRSGAYGFTPFAYLLVGLGLPMVVASGSDAVRRGAFVAYGTWSVPALVLGLRGEVVLAVFASVVVEARRRRLPWRHSFALYGLGGLALGSLIRVGRVGGGWQSAALNPIDGLLEMGYSIRPVAVAWTWQVVWAEPAVGWGTYWAPVERLVTGLLGGSTLSASEDPRVFSSVIADRVGPIGGSPVAEAFRAEGLVGVLVVMFLIGGALAALERVGQSPIRNAGVGASTYILLLWVRNDFTPVPFELISLGLLLLTSKGITLATRGGRRQALRA